MRRFQVPQKDSSLRAVVCAAVAVAICIAYIVWVTVNVSEGIESISLTVASVIVSAATLASIAFAVVIYLESTVLSKRVDDAKKEAQQDREKIIHEMQYLRNVYYELAKTSVKGLRASFMSLPSGDPYKKAMIDLRVAEIDIHLAYGTYDGLIKAIQGSFKHNKRQFLDIEAELWEKSKLLEESKKQVVRQYYLALKKRLLDLYVKNTRNTEESKEKKAKG
jgi:hypothetical protein